MGLKGWYPFLRKKGYVPTVIQQSGTTAASTTFIRRIDLLSRFSVIRNAYTQNSVQRAHEILEKDIERFGCKDDIIVYVDRVQAQEKELTAQARQETREKAIRRCEKALDILEDRVGSNLKVRKQHFVDVKTNMASTFYWSLPTRASFVEYLTQAGWKVEACETEADVAIAWDCKPGDVVVSADSDMMAYPTVSTLWRPISKDLILVYDLEDVRRTLNFSVAQLTALAVVSGNDYGKNIYSLGATTNYSIIKAIQGKDTIGTVAEYLSDPKVVSKNSSVKNDQERTFGVAIRVFVHLKQTPVVNNSASIGSPAHDDLRRRFLDLCTLYRLQKENNPAQSSPLEVPIVRLRSSHANIRFKTVESPAVLKRVSGPLGTLPSQEAHSSLQDRSTLLTMSSQPEGHPPLARTRIPKNRQRYSFKSMTGSTRHPPPDNMKVYKFKPYKERTVIPEVSTEDSKAKTKVKAKTKPKTKPKIKTLATSTAQTRKLAIMRHLAYHHPTSSLKVGTLAANIKRVVPTDGVLQQAVTRCIRDAVHEAARTKRESQRTIGKFIEYINKNGLGPTDRRFLDLLCPRVSMKDVEDKEDEEAEKEDEGDEDHGDDLNDKPTSGKDSQQSSFLKSFLTSVYSGNRPKNTGLGSTVNEFIDHLIRLKLYTPPPPSSDGCKHKTAFTPSELVHSVSTQLRVELKKMYKNGSCDLYKMYYLALGL
ncbi:hypothetical protein EDD21DRAFT_355146 [Dissophora ornata]|nr:hypothetical protein EDD21DRAFT_355146 [Dissophora ornata]